MFLRIWTAKVIQAGLSTGNHPILKINANWKALFVKKRTSQAWT